MSREKREAGEKGSIIGNVRLAVRPGGNNRQQHQAPRRQPITPPPFPEIQQDQYGEDDNDGMPL